MPKEIKEFDFLKQYAQKDQRSEYVTLPAKEGESVVYDRKKDQVVKKDAAGTSTLSPKGEMHDLAPLSADGYLPAKTPVKELIPQEAPVEAPKPTGNRQYASPAVAQTTSTKERMTVPDYAPDSSVWERALIGATPLLVGLLSGNALEGAQVASQHVVADEGDRYKRGKDFNQKLAEMAAKREHSTKTDKINAKTFEYRGSDDVNRIGRFVNGQQLIDEVNDPLSPVDAKKENYADFDYTDSKGTPRIGTRINGKRMMSADDPVKYERPVYGREEINAPGTKQPVRVSTKNGELHQVIGNVPEGSKKGLTVQDRKDLEKYKKDLKADELRFKQERELNKDYEGVRTTKDTRDIAAAHAKIMDASFGKNPMSDVATVIGLFKIMDPGSVVRESELALGLNARSWEEVANHLEEIVMKNGYLTPKQREGMRDLADRMYKRQLAIQESSVNSQMRSRSKQYGLNPANVITPIKSPYKEPEFVNVRKNGKVITIPAKHLDKVLSEDPNLEVMR